MNLTNYFLLILILFKIRVLTIKNITFLMNVSAQNLIRTQKIRKIFQFARFEKKIKNSIIAKMQKPKMIDDHQIMSLKNGPLYGRKFTVKNH